MEIGRKITITYRWWNDLDEINDDHVNALDESAMKRINEMMLDGYTSGELHDNIYMHDTDPEEGIFYKGWWKVSSAELI